MAINDPTPPEPTRLTPLDRAVGLYHSMGEDFIELLDHYISCFPEAKRYVFAGPGYLLLGHEETRSNPHIENPATTDPYWYVTYAGSDTGQSLHQFLRLMPYPLDKVGFSRYAKYPERGMRFLSTTRLMKHYGLQT